MDKKLLLAKDSLTDTQRKCAAMLVSMSWANRSDEDIAKALGVKASAIEIWRDDPNFKTFVDSLRPKELDRHKRDIVKALVDKAKSGDIRAIDLYFRLTGDIKAAERGDSNTQGIKIVIERPSLTLKTESVVDILPVNGETVVEQSPQLEDQTG